MVIDIIKNTKKNLKSENIKSIKDLYKSHRQIVCFSNNMKRFDTDIKKFLREKMYFSRNILNKTVYGRKVIKSLFAIIKKNPSRFLKKDNTYKQSTERCICDFIAGMTDRFAINLYKSKK